MNLGVDAIRPAVIAIDLHRGHLDPDVATMPLPVDQSAAVVAANRGFFARARSASIPVVHLLTRYRSVEEIRNNPFWRTRAEDPQATRANVLAHNLEDLPGVQVMPEVYEEGDWIVDTKRRYDCFIGSDLEFTLKQNGFNTLLIVGVNTNSCVLATTVAACCRDFAAIVIEDCVDTMDGPAAHEAALTCVRAAFGWVMTGEQALAVVAPACSA